MHCPQCKTEIASGASFCSNCGTRLSLACPICAAQVQAGAKFCATCGAQIPSETEPGSPDSQKSDLPHPPSPHPIQSEGYERRMVTILFADIAGYSTLSETLDPENLLDIMSRAYPCLLEPIKIHDGMVVQVMGDGVLAYFGTPTAKEDDPERAILSGLEITRRIQSYAQQLHHEQGLQKFNIRVGINTGLVVVGDLNPDKHLEYIALGDAVNLAARLQSIAPPDGVLISHETFRLVQGLFDVIPQEPVSVKGRQQLTQTYLVQQVHPFQQRRHRRGITGVQTPMIGREPEMTALQNHYQDAILGGETALILLYGHAGIGKTRLSDTFIDWVGQQPDAPRMLRGRAIATTQSIAYGILRHLFAKVFNISESDSSATALHKFRQGMQSELDQDQADLVGQLVGFDFSSSSAVAQFIGDPAFAETAILYLTNFIRRLAKRRLLIVFEDLHWMDDSTLDLVTDLVAILSEEPNNHLMILCTARPEFFEHRENWGEGISGFTQLNLRRLSRLRSRALIKDILFHVRSIPEELYDCVLDFTQGNPFFIEELIKMLIEGGVINTSGEEWSVSLDQLANLHVPPTLIGILQARFDSLSQPEKLVIQRASVIGRTFWDGSVRALTEEPGEAQLVNTHLSVLRERGLVFQLERSTIKGNQEYLFKHALVRDAAYESVLLKHRRKYHALIAAWIELHAGERIEEHLSLIAGHYETAGELEKAAVYYERAGAAAKLVNAHHQSVTAARKAIGLIEELLDFPERNERMARLYEMCGDGLAILAQYEPAHQAFLTALSMMSDADTRFRADLERKIGHIFENQRAGYDLIAAQYEKAARLLGEPDDARDPAWWETWCDLQFGQLMLLYWWQKKEEYSHKIDLIRPLIEEHGTPNIRVKFYSALMRHLLLSHRFIAPQAAVDNARAALDALPPGTPPERKADLLFSLGLCQSLYGDIHEGSVTLSTALDLAEQKRDITLQARCCAYLVYSHRLLGNLADVQEYSQRTLETAKKAQMFDYIGTAQAGLAWFTLHRDQDHPLVKDVLDEVRRYAELALDSWQQHGSPWPFHWMALWPLIDITLENGLVSEAIEHARVICGPGQQVVHPQIAPFLLASLAAWEGGSQAEAEQALNHALVIARELNYA